MKVDIAIGKTNYDSFGHVLKLLKNRDKTKRHILITPDRNALNLEERIIDELEEECLTDLSVSTFSRFTNQLIKNASDEFSKKKILSKSACVAIIKRILLNNKNRLLYYSNSVELEGFSSELYETICMFKSCNVLPKDISETNDDFLNKKLSDIKLVYNELEEFLKNEYSDSFNRLIYAVKLIGANVNDTNFYFVDFSDFNFQMYQIIIALIKNANSVSIATVSNSFNDLKNKHIFVNDIYLNVVDICKQLGVYYELNVINDDNVIKNELLSYTPSKIVNKFVGVDYNQYDFDNKHQEVKFLISKIKELFYSKKIKSFDQVAVCVSSINNYRDLINSLFMQSGLPYYLDISENLNDHFLFRFVSCVLKLLSKDFDVYDVLILLKSPLSNVEQFVFEYQKFIDDYGVKFDALIDITKLNKKINIPENVKKVYDYFSDNFLGFIDIKSEYNVKEIVDQLIIVFNKIKLDDVIKSVYEKFINQNDIVNSRLLKKAYNNMMLILDDLKEVFSNVKMSVLEFKDVFNSYVEDLTISQPPIEIDSIFIGDADKSYFKKVDYLFVLGASDGEFPAYSQDLGIISDSEISLLNNKHKISPTVALINKRRKFKLYELMFLANIELNLFYVSATASGEECYPSIFLRSLNELGVLNIKNGKQAFDISNLLLNQKDKIFLNNDLALAKDNFVSALKNWDIFYDNVYYRENINYLYSILKDFNSNEIVNNCNYKNDVGKLNHTYNFFLNNENISISQFETYFKCPYMHYATYGLKLKDVKNELDKRIYGNIIHEFLKHIVPQIVEQIKNRTSCDLAELINITFDKVLSKKEYAYIIQNPFNSINIVALKEESYRIVQNLIYQFKNSKFLPIEDGYEIPFYKFGANASFKVGDKVIKLKGIIDRVDRADSSFRIIDYKTGSDKFTDFTELFSGKKIQLIVYLDVFAKSNTELKPAGAFYLPIKNNFALDSDSETYMLTGILENSVENYLNMDVNLDKSSYASKIIDLKTRKNGSFSLNNTYKNLCLNEEQMSVIRKFAYDLMQKAVCEIAEGAIQPFPLEITNRKSCEFCKFRGICLFDESFSNKTRKVDKVTSVDELKNKFYGEN